MKRMKGNRGAALVAVLIGILFIAILASSLLFMSTMNYQMKGMRNRASDNFYSAEYAMADMLSQIKQMSYASDTPKTTLQAYLKGPGNTFNAANLQKLIGYTSGGGVLPDISTARVSCIYDGSVASYEEAGNYILLKGVKLDTTTTDGYESSIVTDIKIGFPKSTDAPGKLNDFSILSDSPLNLNRSSQYFGGDIYVRATGALGDGGGDALKVGKLSNVTFMGNFCFIDGNLTIEDGGHLYLNGTTYVRGNIVVKGKGRLLVGNDLYVKGTSSGNVEYKDTTFNHGSAGVKWENYDKYNAGLAGMLVAPVMHLHRDDTSTGKDMTFNQTEFRNKCHNGGLNRGDCFVSKTRADGVVVGACYLTNQQNLSSGWDFENTLIIGGGCPTMYQGTMKNCTYLNVDSTKVLEIDIQTGGFPWGTMDDESFELARKLWVKTKSDDPSVQVATAENMTVDDLVAVPGRPGHSTIGAGGVEIVQYTSDADSKPFYYKDGAHNVNYFPFDNFLDKDINKTLREFKGAAGGDDDGSAQPMIALSNWSKE